MHPEDFFPSPEKTTILEEVKQQLSEETGLLDPEQLRSQQDWGFLADKVVGAEE